MFDQLALYHSETLELQLPPARQGSCDGRRQPKAAVGHFLVALLACYCKKISEEASKTAVIEK